jgi:K+ transporter
MSSSIMRAGNNGEGGVWRLGAALGASRAPVSRPAKDRDTGMAALMGLALFYGDGHQTPAISVLSAMEGLGASDAFKPGIIASPWDPGGAVPAAESRHRKNRQGIRSDNGC